MDIESLLAVLTSSGIPFRYYAWPPSEVPQLPYGVYLQKRSNNFFADGEVCLEITRYQVELYTKQKDPASEKKVEDALGSAGIAWEKTEEYIQEERVFEILYEIEVCNHGKHG